MKHWLPSQPLGTQARWHELANVQGGRGVAVIVGKGPSLDAWLAEGCPLPSERLSHVIGVNHAGAVIPRAFRPTYNVSGHKFAEFAQIPGQWVCGVNSQDTRQERHWEIPDYVSWWFLVVYGWSALSYTREEIAETRRLFHLTSSAQLAVHFAWYLGFEEVLLVGNDGGREHAQAMRGVAGVTAPTTDYDMLKRDTEMVCERLFPGKWGHWAPAAAEMMKPE